MNVDISFEHPDLVVEFGSRRGGFTIIRVRRTDIATVELFSQWARAHDILGKEVLDRMWKWLEEHEWN